MTKFEYSKSEMKLIKHFGYEKLANDTNTSPVELYRMMAMKAFDMDDRTPYAEAVRKANRAINNCNPYRGTLCFDKLIEIKEEDFKPGDKVYHKNLGLHGVVAPEKAQMGDPSSIVVDFEDGEMREVTKKMLTFSMRLRMD